MKKFFISMIAAFALLFVANIASAQSTLKLGVFDPEDVVRSLPEFGKVDTAIQQYQRDSLGEQYTQYMSEYQRLDSTYKADSIAKRPKAILQSVGGQRQQIAMTLAYWQQYSQQATQAKYSELAGPLYQKVQTSFNKVRLANKVTVVLTRDALMFAEPNAVTNLSLLVAKDLGIKVPEEEGGAKAPAAGGRK